MYAFFVFSPLSFVLLTDNCFSSHRFHRYTQIFFIGRFFIGLSSWEIFHRISRMNRKAFLLIGLLTDFRGYLASGQWLAPDICSCCFFVTQISQMTQIFLRGRVCPTDFTDYHRFFMESLINLFVQSQGLSATTGQVASAKIRE